MNSLKGLGIAAVLCAMPAAGMAITLVTDLTPGTGWDNSVTNSGGTAAIVDLTGTGGNLENNAPDTNGAVRLTTDSTNGARAEAGIGVNFGVVADIFDGDLSFSYSWYNSGATGGPGAPSFKLAFFDPTYSGDGFGQLIYEPYWQGALGTTTTPTTDDWVTSQIDLDNGYFWTSGMFGIASSAGGPPLRTLGEWLSAFNTADPAGFAESNLVGLSIGMGTFNPDEVGYFDRVSIAGTDLDADYDFTVAATVVPVPASLPLLLGGLGALGLARRMRRRAT